MKISAINYTREHVELTKVCFWIGIADEHLQFLQTKHLQCIVLHEDLHTCAVALVYTLANQDMTNLETLLRSRLWFLSFSTTFRAEVQCV